MTVALDRSLAPAPAPRSSASEPHPAAEQLATVVSNAWVNQEYKHLVLACGDPATRTEPGQFFHLLCPPSGDDAPFLRRPMSVYRVDAAAGRVEFLYKITGAGTRGIALLEPSDRFDMLGPLGIGFRLHESWRHIVVVGRGVGLATLAPLAQSAQARGIGVTAILSARRPELLMSVDLFRAQGAVVLAVTDSEGTSGPAHVERLLHELIAAGKAQAFFTCGSNRLMLLLQRLGHEHGIPGQVALEQQMACGLGMCFCCVREFRVEGAVIHRRVCWEGPVFDLQEAVSW
jgi:dihydroorotate dehydrogenase electron transfer subunit